MAVQNYWNNLTNNPPQATPAGQDAEYSNTGIRPHILENSASVAAADSSGSTYLLFKNVPWNARLRELKLENDNLGAGAQIQIGLADSRTGTIISATCLSAAQSAAAANGKNAPLDGLAALTHAQTLQALYETALDTPIPPQGPYRFNYDVVMTLSTAGGSAGVVTARGILTPAG
ncbi:MAG TPA: hypothetical protein V6D22_13650 [Candidatus Obscuribacterales bacterium]